MHTNPNFIVSKTHRMKNTIKKNRSHTHIHAHCTHTHTNCIARGLITEQHQIINNPPNFLQSPTCQNKFISFSLSPLERLTIIK